MTMAVRNVGGRWINSDGVIVDVVEIGRVAALESPTRRDAAMGAGAGLSLPETRWHVLRIGSRADEAVDNVLTEAGIEHWMPTELANKRGGQIKSPALVQRPAMPGYIFVNVVWTAALWHRLCTVEGIVGALGGMIRPFVVDPMEVAEKRKFFGLTRGERNRMVAKEGALKPGDRVMIVKGEMRGHCGTVREIRKDGRARLSMPLFFGGEMPATVPLDVLAKRD